MRILSIRNPHASLILRGCKTIEVRTWKTGFRGRLGIHVSTKRDPMVGVDDTLMLLPEGHLVGEVDLLGCREMLPTDGLAAHSEYRQGAYAWDLANPVVYDIPTSVRGRLGLWRLPKDSLYLED